MRFKSWKLDFCGAKAPEKGYEMKMGERRGARERPHAGKINAYREDRLRGCLPGNGLCEWRLERRTVQEHKA